MRLLPGGGRLSGSGKKPCRDCRKHFNKNWYEGDAKQRHLKNVKERKQAARMFGIIFPPILLKNAARLILLSLNFIIRAERKELLV